MALQLRSRGRTLGNPSLIHFFSTTSSSNLPSPDSNDSNGQSDSSSPSKVFGGSEPFVFGRESREKKDGHSSNAMRTEFVKMNNYGELGEKLRPEAKGEGCFSSGELNDRLMKLRDMEEKVTESKAGGFTFTDLRESLAMFKQQMEEEKESKGK